MGGAEASPGSWPWQVLVQVYCTGGHGYDCGGSLVNHNWILTAAHCLDDCVEEVTGIYLGSHNLSSVGPHGVYRTAAKWELHELYSCGGYEENDIALVKLSAPVSYTDYIQPVCLAQKDSTFHSGVKTWVAGWGNLDEEGNYTSPLQEVSVPIVGDNECRCSFDEPIPDKTICAGYEEGGQDSCQGDSGGALVVKNDTVWVQVGIVSFGIGCARPKLPGVYTEVSKFQDWIERILGTVDPPGFVKFTSPGEDSDKSYNCTHDRPPLPPCIVTPVPTTRTPTTTTIVPTTAAATTTTTAATTMILCLTMLNL